MTIPVAIAMPWRPTPERQEAHDFVVRWMGEELPDAPVLEVDTDHEPYNLAAARNAGVRAAQDAGAEVVVITDADAYIGPRRHLHDAIAGARARGGMVHMPFTNQLYLDADQTADLIRTGDCGLPAEIGGNGVMYVCTPDTYWAAGGSDERCRGWGGDDDCFVAAARTLVGLARHDGVAYSLHHADASRPIGSPGQKLNAQLAARYWSVLGNLPAMRRLIAEPGRHSTGSTRPPVTAGELP